MGTVPCGVQSKWWRDDKIGPRIVKHPLEQAEIVKQRKGNDLDTLRI